MASYTNRILVEPTIPLIDSKTFDYDHLVEGTAPPHRAFTPKKK